MRKRSREEIGSKEKLYFEVVLILSGQNWKCYDGEQIAEAGVVVDNIVVLKAVTSVPDFEFLPNKSILFSHALSSEKLHQLNVTILSSLLSDLKGWLNCPRGEHWRTPPERVVSFLNFENKRELDKVEWIPRDKKNEKIEEREICG